MHMLFHDLIGSGPLLLLLHPIGLDRSFWGDLSEKLARRYTVVPIDTAGHGSSPEPERPGRMQARVQDVVDLLTVLDRGPATLVGVSFGGMIAQQVALARPDLVAALVLGGCPGAVPVSARGAILQRGVDAERDGMASVLDATMERWFTPAFLSTEAADEVRRHLLSVNPSAWAAGWEAIAEHDALDGLARLDLPALVVAGEADRSTLLEVKRTLSAAIPNSRLVVLEDAPHMMQIECPDAFADAVTGFLDTLPDTPAR